MSCYSPIEAFRSLTLKTPKGGSKIFFDPSCLSESPCESIRLPCGSCIGCRIDRSRMWALRCVHESVEFNFNCFITLTIDDEHFIRSDKKKCSKCERFKKLGRMCPYGSLCVKDFQDFMKRLRKRFTGIDKVVVPEYYDEYNDVVVPSKETYPIRYFHCGEYGTQLDRPHHHAILFNFDFLDKEFFKLSNGNRLYTSESLTELWSFGYSFIGDVTFESCAYVARYCMKKVNSKGKYSHYLSDVDKDTGEMIMLTPEYATMSRRPGIGSRWFYNFKQDLEKDYVTLNGTKFKLPRYYDNLYKYWFPQEFKELKKKRLAKFYEHADNNTIARLDVRRECQERKAVLLKRSIEL